MNLTISGYRIKGKSRGALKHWNGLFEEWILAIERYCRISDGDAPYWYNERANISVLAGAAWRSGWIALEEFQMTKVDIDDETNEVIVNDDFVKRLGRADLYISSGSSNEYIEAKFRWLSLDSKDLIGNISRTHEKAQKDALKAKGMGDTTHIAVTFVAFYAKEKKLEIIDELISNAVEQFGDIDSHAFAWCFPEVMRDSTHDVSKNTRPGVAIFAKLMR